MLFNCLNMYMLFNCLVSICYSTVYVCYETINDVSVSAELVFNKETSQYAS